MSSSIFNQFRLVGGTSLSLQMGHRQSIDIDLFTDSPYGSIDFEKIEWFFNENFRYTSSHKGIPVALGSSWFIGDSADNSVKIDIYYTDPYIRPAILLEEIRLAAKEDIIAMKLEVLGNTGRKKDFWDLHRLHEDFSFKSMIELHKERFPFSHSLEELRLALTNFSNANDDLDPICLLEKQWPLIKLDFVEWSKEV